MSCRSKRKLKRSLPICDLSGSSWPFPQPTGCVFYRGGLQRAALHTYFYSECLENFSICKRSEMAFFPVGNPLRLNLYKIINVQKQRVRKMLQIIRLQKEDSVFPSLWKCRSASRWSRWTSEQKTAADSMERVIHPSIINTQLCVFSWPLRLSVRWDVEFPKQESISPQFIDKLQLSPIWFVHHHALCRSPHRHLFVCACVSSSSW